MNRIIDVLTRDQVLHVAKLARLNLTDEDVELYIRELSGVLDYVEKVEELDLADVAPTSHVVPVENVLRADTPRPSLSREEALASAPDPGVGGFRVPSPGVSE